MDRARLEALAAKHGIRLLLRFGSTVSGRIHPRSDVDLAVLLDRHDRRFDTYADLRADLQALVPGEDLDLAVINHADPLFLKQVVDGCALLYGSEEALADLKLYAWKRYLDHRRFLDMERAWLAGRIRALAR
jgi:uncharacterized protein